MIDLSAGAARCAVSPDDGGRVAALTVAGIDLLVERDAHPMMWGSFPMVPWAGRIRHGHFRFDGIEYQLPTNLPPHAPHGTAFTQPWVATRTGASSVEMRCDLGSPWPFGGEAWQRIELGAHGLVCDLAVTAGPRPMPAQLGWHPWFAKPDAADLRFARMYQRDADGIPSGELVDPPAGPHDDCFVEPFASPTLRYGALTLTIESDCDHWVVYDELAHATCVEPQTGPPDAFNLGLYRLDPGETLRRFMHLAWTG